jgi:hypothetical protein
VVRIEVADTDRAKDLIRVLVTRIGAEPVSLDRRAGEVCVDLAPTEEVLSEVLDSIDQCLGGSAVAIVRIGRNREEKRSFRVGERTRASA